MFEKLVKFKADPNSQEIYIFKIGGDKKKNIRCS